MKKWMACSLAVVTALVLTTRGVWAAEEHEHPAGREDSDHRLESDPGARKDPDGGLPCAGRGTHREGQVDRPAHRDIPWDVEIGHAAEPDRSHPAASLDRLEGEADAVGPEASIANRRRVRPWLRRSPPRWWHRPPHRPSVAANASLNRSAHRDPPHRPCGDGGEIDRPRPHHEDRVARIDPGTATASPRWPRLGQRGDDIEHAVGDAVDEVDGHGKALKARRSHPGSA